MFAAGIQSQGGIPTPVLVLAFLFGVSLAVNLYQARHAIIRKLLAVPAPDLGSSGFITTSAGFADTIVELLEEQGYAPICTAHSEKPNIPRFLFPGGRIINTEHNEAFLKRLGDPKAFMALVSSEPEKAAHDLSSQLSKLGYGTEVVKHHDPSMKDKMFFVSFAGSSYNPGWVIAFRLHGSKMGRTKRWNPLKFDD